LLQLLARRLERLFISNFSLGKNWREP